MLRAADTKDMIDATVHLEPEVGLLRPPTRELQVLTWSKQLRPVRFDDHRAVTMLSHAIHGLQCARNNLERPHLACGHIHSSLYTLCLATLYLHGLQPYGKEGQKELVVQWGLEHLQIDIERRARALWARHLWLTTMAGASDGTELHAVPDLVETTTQSLANARMLHPDWFG
ncbi:hypothetical protein RQP54_17025 [Curvibacter sp. APW13]|uniref:hypothetical protein n=1 Tax=Curvibacter sp. APW13 TaxID=3077236 RepID=UPI0028E0791E|nr:hypothetical protein [Curvibacter sp. APW13]MDT8992577.1 hypothetical protein [Curvibacter sp. APW13]